jgi:hypothetical protein
MLELPAQRSGSHQTRTAAAAAALWETANQDTTQSLARLTATVAEANLRHMSLQAEPMQQPIRKAVGRPVTPSQQLACVEDLTAFIQKNVPEAFARREGDRFPVRKAVGRPRLGRR